MEGRAKDCSKGFGSRSKLLRLGFGGGRCWAEGASRAGGGGEGAVERLDFSDVAALFAQFYAFVHRARTVFGNEACGFFGLRMKDGEADVRIAEADLRDQCPRFGVEAAGVEGDDGNRQVGGGDSVGNDHVFRRQAGGKNGLGEALRDLSEALVEQADFFGQSGRCGLVGRRWCLLISNF